ncbi:MAG: hypothetical protein CO189_11400 [candidate division Zixibacteria bacterium CG_4_9_14_3_um_filter_46_8]|nr:MAG: hypothetical protein CO189_11400 [candidate division Zixibacteria bacterium CG_4_9_14_3_um_filter_46_8]
MDVRMGLETHVLNEVHIVMTTLGSAGNRTLEGTEKFEVVVVDEAAQSVEPATLSALQLGSRHCVLVGDPQQLPATIFNVSGRNTKYDRSLFQRLEEAGQPVYMLNEQYRYAQPRFDALTFYGRLMLLCFSTECTRRFLIFRGTFFTTEIFWMVSMYETQITGILYCRP